MTYNKDEMLKPCPFCGGEPALDNSAADHLAIMQIVCTHCGGMGPFADTADGDAEDRSRSLWNARNGAARQPIEAPSDIGLVERTKLACVEWLKGNLDLSQGLLDELEASGNLYRTAEVVILETRKALGTHNDG